MTLGENINKIRTEAKLTQEEFAALLNVSQQSVQKWENDVSAPSLENLKLISKYFCITLDFLILGNDNRTIEEMRNSNYTTPLYESLPEWEFYPSNPMIEYSQSYEEGLDVEKYKDIFVATSKLPKGAIKKKLGDVLFEIVTTTEQRKDYKYIEPSDLETIKNLRKPHSYLENITCNTEDKVKGAWMGRICGCMLGKTVEGIRTNELISFLKETENYPMHRYILRSDLNEEIQNKYNYPFASRSYADEIDGMPVDDDTNYTVLYQEIIEKYGRDFTPFDVSRAWLNYQPKNAYCTAERVAFCNFIKGYAPPDSAIYKNPYREWIGAQIRGDYFGYINPGKPELAAEMAWRDASISHTKNGIYGEMFVAAMIAVAAETNKIKDIILGGLAEIPHTSRLHKEIMSIINDFENGVSQKDCFANIHQKYNEHSGHDWCHTISNAVIVVASLLYGNGDYGKSVCMAVEAGFDTDCNAATAGSILGMANGIESISEEWTKPINDTLYTSIFGIDTVKISDRVKQTLKHIR